MIAGAISFVISARFACPPDSGRKQFLARPVGMRGYNAAIVIAEPILSPYCYFASHVAYVRTKCEPV